jgi:DegV family protein with EDD domain
VTCLPRDLIDQYHIEIIPLTLLAGGKVYHDGVDITPAEAYELFLKEPDSFKTSPSSPTDCLAAFQRAAARAKNILCITVSVNISTVYNVANIARERAKTELPEVRIEVMDSETAATAQGFVVLAAARAVQAGKSFEEVIEIARQVKSKVHAVILLDTVRHVYRSGRVPKIAAQAAAVLNIKPVFTLYTSVNFVTAVRSRKNGIEKMISMMRDKIDDKPIHCAVVHAYDPVEDEKLKERVASEFNCLELFTSEFSPVMGYATGTGTLGIAFYAES